MGELTKKRTGEADERYRTLQATFSIMVSAVGPLEIRLEVKS